MSEALLARWHAVPTAWREAVRTTAWLWLGTAVIVVVAAGTLPVRELIDVAPDVGFAGWVPPPADASGLQLLGTGLVRFDALWYLAIAADGYPQTATVPPAAAFFPGYPLVVAGVGVLTGGRLVLAAQLVSAVAAVSSLVGVRRLVELLTEPLGLDEGAARRAGGALALFPTAFFLLAPYSESLFLAATVWALVHAARERTWAAFALAALASATRPVGVLLGLPLLLGVVHVTRPLQPDPVTWLRTRLLPAAGAGIGIGAVCLNGWVRWGDPFAPLSAQAAWQRDWEWPWLALADALRFGLSDPGAGATGYHTLDVLVLAIVLTALVWLVRRGPTSLAVHTGATVLLWLAQPFPGRPLVSTTRFALVVPGITLAIAALTSRPAVERAWWLLGGGLFAVHLTLFTRWWYVF